MLHIYIYIYIYIYIKNISCLRVNETSGTIKPCRSASMLGLTLHLLPQFEEEYIFEEVIKILKNC